MSTKNLHQSRAHATAARMFPLQPHLNAPQFRALRAAVAAYRRSYEANGWARTAGGRFWIGNAEAAIKLLAPEHRWNAA